MANNALFEVSKLHLSLPDMSRKPLFGKAPAIHILKGLNFQLTEGQITGIVGESGSGKTTLGRLLVRLLTPSEGDIIFRGQNITNLDEKALKPLRRDLQIIFQDPLSSLNPRHTVGHIIRAPMQRYGLPNATQKTQEMLERVGLPSHFVKRYPHELSGGQRQRVGIARAIALEPAFILADEIVSGLDVSSQAQVLALLQELASDLKLTVAFISHDLSVIRNVCQDVIVLNQGQIVEQGSCERIFTAPSNPITQTLLNAIPLPEIDDSWFDNAS